MLIVKRFLSVIGLTFPFELAVWQAGVGVQPLSFLDSPSDKTIGTAHAHGTSNGQHLTYPYFLSINGVTFKALTCYRFLNSPLSGN